MLASLYVPCGLSAPRMGEHTIQLLLSGMSLHAAAIFRAGTLVPQLTSRTGLRRCLVLVVVSLSMVVSPLQCVPCGTGEGIMSG